MRWVLGCLALVYVLAFPYHPKLVSPNELCRLLQTRALVEYHTLDLNQALHDYGRVGDLSFFQGRYYPSKAPLLSFAAVPLYAVLRLFGGSYRYAVPEVPLMYFARLLLTVAPTLFLLWLLWRFLSTYVSTRVTAVMVVTYGLGTLGFSYSLLFMSHQTIAVLLFAAFFVLWRIARGEWSERGYLLAGALAGATVAAEYTGALGVAGLVVYVLAVFHVAPGTKRERGVRLARAGALSLVGAAPFLIFLGWYHAACFGSPFTTGYKHLADAAYQPWHLGGFLGIRTPGPRAFVLSFFSPLRGLFTLSPFLLLSFPGLVLLYRRARGDATGVKTGQVVQGPATSEIAGTMAGEMGRGQWPYFILPATLWLLYAYFTSSFTYDSWGWTTGPRHLTGLVPFQLLPVALVLEKLGTRAEVKGRLQRAASAGLCAASIAVTGLLTCVNYIPDDVVNGVYGLALPLFSHGFLPPTVLSFLGVPNPAAGLVLVLGLAVAVAWVLWVGSGGDEGQGRTVHAAGAGASTVVLVAYLALLSLARPNEHDAAAARFLAHAWLAPPGEAVAFWPR